MRKSLTRSPEPKRKKSDLVDKNFVEIKAAGVPPDMDHHITNHDAVKAAEALLMFQNSENERVSLT